ncbi:MAG: hypothetical protein CMF62_02355 [Magnetococcales bacterium]|nr:hypothetical protein [Magnetococcales bacterium]|tara:strand:+ start:14321 stop:14905 length:585 start_codon:yes stop_codon:yes gene_type:complete
MKTRDFLLLLVLFVSTLLFFSFQNNEVTYVRSDIDNEKYLVRDLPDKQRAANMLSRIKINIDKLVEHLVKVKDEHPDFTPFIEQLQKRIKNVDISESTPDSAYTSYSVNKGEQLVFCVRSKSISDKMHDINLIMYVCLHELAHVGNPEYGHGEQFQRIFAFFTKEAMKIGLYEKIDFYDNAVEYCGMNINESIV